MPFWNLTKSQTQTLALIISGKHVWDMGAGDGSLARRCIELGANKVTAVDSKEPPGRENPTGRIRWIHNSFAGVPAEPRDIILLAWPWDTSPSHQTQALFDHLTTARIAIVLAKNTNGSRCGTAPLWKLLSGRRLLASDPDTANDLAVYDMTQAAEREPTPLEAAGMDDLEVHPFQPFHLQLKSPPWENT